MDDHDKRTIGVLILIVVIVAVGVLMQAYNEAATYRRLTGKNVSTWDALWVDLRVQEGVK